MQFLKEAFLQNSDKPFFIGDVTANYREVYEKVTTSYFLQSNSISFVCISEGASAVFAYLTCTLQSVVPLMLSEKLKEFQIKCFKKIYNPKYIIQKIDGPFKNEMGEFEEFQTEFFGETIFIYKMKTNQSIGFSKASLLLPTSGSTGDPKLVMLSENNLKSNVRSICKSLELCEHDTVSLTLPLNYSFGLSIINSHIISGTRILITKGSLLDKNYWKNFLKYGVKCVYGVPYQFEILKKLKIFTKIPKGLRFFAQAGGAMNLDLTNWFLEHCRKNSKQLYIMYGQTECAPRISCFDLVKHPKKIGSVGRALDCCSVSIEKKENSKIGEICISGENIFLGYAEENNNLFSDRLLSSCHRTGDLGFIDNDGFIFIEGRKKRFVKVYGSSVNLDHLQAMLQKINPELVITGIDNKVNIFLVGSVSDKNLIKNEIENHTTINKNAVYYKHIGKIPRLLSGKINFKALESYK